MINADAKLKEGSGAQVLMFEMAGLIGVNAARPGHQPQWVPYD